MTGENKDNGCDCCRALAERQRRFEEAVINAFDDLEHAVQGKNNELWVRVIVQRLKESTAEVSPDTDHGDHPQ